MIAAHLAAINAGALINEFTANPVEFIIKYALIAIVVVGAVKVVTLLWNDGAGKAIAVLGFTILFGAFAIGAIRSGVPAMYNDGRAAFTVSD